MNYLKTYCKLIRFAERREKPGGYLEKHHTFPKSIYGNNKRIVLLTAREHYIAHALLEKGLIKRYGAKNWKSRKMIYAFWAMNNKKKTKKYYNSYLYEQSRKNIIELSTGKRLSVKTKEKLKQLKLGRKLSTEQKEKIRKSCSGKFWWTDGIKTKYCKECPENGWYKGRPNINIGRKMSEETKKKISNSKKGKKLTADQRKNISQRNKELKWWVNQYNEKVYKKECPGPEWKNGMIWR